MPPFLLDTVQGSGRGDRIPIPIPRIRGNVGVPYFQGFYDGLTQVDITNTASVTELPIETGFVITDNVVIEPRKFMIKGVTSDLYSTSAGGAATIQRVTLAYDLMETTLRDKIMLALWTPWKIFENLVITELSAPINFQTGAALKFDMTLQEVLIADSFYFGERDEEDYCMSDDRIDAELCDLNGGTRGGIIVDAVPPMVIIEPPPVVRNPDPPIFPLAF